MPARKNFTKDLSGCSTRKLFQFSGMRGDVIMVTSGGMLTVSDAFTRCESYCSIHGSVAFFSGVAGKAVVAVIIFAIPIGDRIIIPV